MSTKLGETIEYSHIKEKCPRIEEEKSKRPSRMCLEKDPATPRHVESKIFSPLIPLKLDRLLLTVLVEEIESH